jgi:hypothetical protein
MLDIMVGRICRGSSAPARHKFVHGLQFFHKRFDDDLGGVKHDPPGREFSNNDQNSISDGLLQTAGESRACAAAKGCEWKPQMLFIIAGFCAHRDSNSRDGSRLRQVFAHLGKQRARTVRLDSAFSRARNEQFRDDIFRSVFERVVGACIIEDGDCAIAIY